MPGRLQSAVIHLFLHVYYSLSILRYVFIRFLVKGQHELVLQIVRIANMELKTESAIRF